MSVLTDRTAPAPYRVCDGCGAVPALRLPEGYEECGKCHKRRVLLQAAEEHLSAAFTPTLGAWVHHWQAAGVSRKQLSEVLDMMTAELHTLAGCAVVIEQAAAAYPVPTYAPAQPSRFAVDVGSLPRLSHWEPIPNRAGFAHFADTQGKAQVLGRGQDIAVLTFEDGGAVVLPVGLGGKVGGRFLDGALYVPASLMPRVQAQLSGEGEA